MFQDLIQQWVEPTPDQFDAYYYDIDGPRYDFSQVPDFLREYMEYPEFGSGTNKYLYLFYQLASRAMNIIEVGTFTGVATIAFAKGVANNNGTVTCIDINLTRPLLHQRIQQHALTNVMLKQGDSLSFRSNQMYDLIWIDSAHTYEHTVKELFHYEKYLKPGGIFIIHDIINPLGLNLVDSNEDYGYINARDYINAYYDNEDGQRNRHISQWPVCIPAQRCLMSPIFLAIQTFLSYRKAYTLLKNMDFAGIAILIKPGP